MESIADAVVINDEDFFFLSAPDGQVPLRGRHGLGLYLHDCRFLDGYGLDDAARKIFDGITRAAIHFPSYRLPEVFAGF